MISDDGSGMSMSGSLIFPSGVQMIAETEGPGFFLKSILIAMDWTIHGSATWRSFIYGTRKNRRCFIWLPEFAAKLNYRGCVGRIPVSVRHSYADYWLDQIQAAFGKLQQSQGTQVQESVFEPSGRPVWWPSMAWRPEIYRGPSYSIAGT
jgi:hypothetical protein